MTAQTELRRALRERVGPVLRTAGYRGTSPNWRRLNEEGDCAVVNVQSSAYSSADSVTCILNLSLVPSGWPELMTELQGHRRHASVPYYWGVYQRRIDAPTEPTGWWEVTDHASADAVAAQIASALSEVALPELAELLVRERLLEHVRRGGPEMLMGGSTVAVEALLLADAGRHEELHQLLPRLSTELADWTLLAKFTDWVLSRSRRSVTSSP